MRLAIIFILFASAAMCQTTNTGVIDLGGGGSGEPVEYDDNVLHFDSSGEFYQLDYAPDGTGNMFVVERITTGEKYLLETADLRLQEFQISDLDHFGVSDFNNLFDTKNLGDLTEDYIFGGGSGLFIKVGSVPSASPNFIALFAEDVSSSAELKVKDEAGNTTTLSPHNFSLIGKPSHEMAWSYYSERDGKAINVDMFRVVQLLEQLTGEKLIHIKDLK